MEGEKIIESITKTINDRLKIPIIITYISVLILYNWDILFYLIFEKETASIKIACIKEEYSSEYWCRILTCIAISIGLITVFTIINTILNYLLKGFYRKDKEITSEINDFETIKNKNQQIADALDKIKDLNTQIKNLNKINEGLATNINISDIAKKDYDILIADLSLSTNKEKLLFSLKELINILKEDDQIDVNDIYNKSSYSNEMNILLKTLSRLNLIEETNPNGYYSTLKIGTSFKEFLKMDL